MTKFYICEHCGNLVNAVHDCGVPMMCCGKKMAELRPGTVDASREKHLPVITIEGNVVRACVGEVEHPMQAEHSILWICLETDKGVYRKHLAPGAVPAAAFTLMNETAVAAYAYCNLHGLWMAEVAAESACEVEAAPPTTGENYTVCRCNRVSYFDVVNALEAGEQLGDVLKAFEHIKESTHCSTGCGACHDKVMAIISEKMMG